MARRKSDYSRTLTPFFDAVEDVKDWLGERGWRELQKELKYTAPLEFWYVCKRYELTPFQIQAVYDMIHGEKAWIRDVNDKTGVEAVVAEIRALAEKGPRS